MPTTENMWEASIKTCRFDDIDAQADQLAGYDQRYQQLSRGRFDGQFAVYAFGNRLSINIEHTNRMLSEWGARPPDDQRCASWALARQPAGSTARNCPQPTPCIGALALASRDA